MAANGTSLAAALIAFNNEAPPIHKDSTNPFFNSRYASLDSIMDTVRPVLTKHGLAISQHPAALDSGMPALRTILLHVSGDSLEDVMPLSVEKPGPQALGSALTYARRYAVLAVLGLVADVDDDANSAERKDGDEPAFQAPAPRAGADPASDAQRKAMYAIATKLMESGKLTESQRATLVAASNDPGTTRAAAGAAIEKLKKIEAEALIEAEA